MTATCAREMPIYSSSKGLPVILPKAAPRVEPRRAHGRTGQGQATWRNLLQSPQGLTSISTVFEGNPRRAVDLLSASLTLNPPPLNCTR